MCHVLYVFVHLRRGKLSAKLLLEEEAVVEKAVYIPVKVQVSLSRMRGREKERERERGDNNSIRQHELEIKQEHVTKKRRKKTDCMMMIRRMIMKEHHEKTRG